MFLTGGVKALATVTAIIDGMGSCGAALGPVLTGHLVVTLRGGFANIFLMLYIAAAAAGLLLSKLAYKEASLTHCCSMQSSCLPIEMASSASLWLRHTYTYQAKVA